MKIHHKITFICCLLLLGSCTKKFLDVKNTQRLFRETYVQDLTTMKEYVRGIYSRLSLTYESGDAVNAYAELMADNLRPMSVTSSPATDQQYYWSQDPINSYTNFFWEDSYFLIRMCNFVVGNVGAYRNENSTLADELKGQALAVRSLVYFKMINMFAQPYGFTTDASHPGVPYVLTDDPTQPYSRQPTKDVYDGMIKDLTEAIALLPSTTTDTRYMNQAAAKALLARTYLFKADYVNAKVFALEVAEKVPLMTQASGYPDNIFKFNSPTNTEVLFQLSPSQVGYLNYYFRTNPAVFVSTTDMASILKEDPNDIRNNWVADSSYGWQVNKFPVNSAPEAVPAVPIPEISYYPAILRSSEMFLTVAEAAAKTNDENMAKEYLNAIRKRANPLLGDVTATGDALLDSINKERRKELAFENLRLFDLLRWKKGVNRIDALPGAPLSLPYPSQKAIAPIPEREVRISGMPQNPSY
jgi:starch-binding outer membrane protein, SusD/RagB family